MRTIVLIILLFLLMIVVIPALTIFRLIHKTRSQARSFNASQSRTDASAFAQEDEELSTEEKLASKRFDKSKAEDVEFEEVEEVEEPAEQ